MAAYRRHARVALSFAFASILMLAGCSAAPPPGPTPQETGYLELRSDITAELHSIAASMSADASASADVDARAELRGGAAYVERLPAIKATIAQSGPPLGFETSHLLWTSAIGDLASAAEDLGVGLESNVSPAINSAMRHVEEATAKLEEAARLLEAEARANAESP
jgi:hypothetical protein